MNLYDECFASVDQLLKGYTPKRNGNAVVCPDAGQNQLLFKSDTAYELGGKNLSALSAVFLTDSEEAVSEDEVLLYGPDLSELKADSPYARIALIRVNEGVMASGSQLYSAIRKIEYTRYHLNPEGYMMRISPMNRRECVRIGKDAVKKGLSFFGVGKLFIEGYHKHEAVERVKLIFITEPNFPYDKLTEATKKSEDITKALDHLVNKVKMDCDVCGLKNVCAEVEELCKTDFPNK